MGRPGGFCDITVEECDASVRSLEGRLHREGETAVRGLQAGDNTGQVGAFQRGRSRLLMLRVGAFSGAPKI